MRKTIEDIRDEFKMRGLTLISKSFKNYRSPLSYKCDKCHTVGKKSYRKLWRYKPCARCSIGQRKASSGAKAVEYSLQRLKIKYLTEHSFPDCRHKLPLRFDFAVLDKNDNLKGLIEYQGRQHYQPVRRYGLKAFKSQQLRDSIKVSYCLQNNIPLLHIPFIIKIKKIPIVVESFLKRESYD